MCYLSICQSSEELVFLKRDRIAWRAQPDSVEETVLTPLDRAIAVLGDFEPRALNDHVLDRICDSRCVLRVGENNAAPGIEKDIEEVYEKRDCTRIRAKDPLEVECDGARAIRSSEKPAYSHHVGYYTLLNELDLFEETLLKDSAARWGES